MRVSLSVFFLQAVLCVHCNLMGQKTKFCLLITTTRTQQLASSKHSSFSARYTQPFPHLISNSKCKLKTCPYCTKTCPHWTCFGSNYLKNGVWLAVTLDKNFNFSKVLLSPKFNYNSISIEVKKKNSLLHRLPYIGVEY